MKILYLITKSEAGGAQTHVKQLSEYFSKNNEVAIMSDGNGWLFEEAQKIGVKFFVNKYFSNSLNPVHLVRSMIEIKNVVNEYRPGIIHCNSSLAAFLGRIVVRNKIPTIYTAHGWGFNIGVSPVQKFLAVLGERIVSRYCSKIICVSKFVKDLAVKYEIASGDKFIVIYNGVEIGIDRDIIYDDKIKLVFVGRLARPKKPMLLLQTLNQLPDDIKNNIELNIIGDGIQKDALENYIKNNKLVNVNLLGALPRHKVIDILKQSHVLVFLSEWEGFPYVILEAMSLGIPVISSDVGGIKEVVDDDCGFLLKSDNDLKDVLLAIVDDHIVVKNKGVISRNKILNNFSMEKMLSQTETVYKELMI